MIKNKKTIILLVILIVIAMIILVIRNFLGTNTDPIPTSSPTSVKFEILAPKSSEELTSVTEIIKFQFSQPVNETSIQLDILPKNKVKISLDPSKTILSVEPEDAWNFNTNYFVKILKTTKSVTDESLEADYTYSFKTHPYSGI